MAVDTRSDNYTKFLSMQLTCRHCYEGEQTLHEHGKEYLPGLEGDDDDREISNYFNNYKSRALYYNSFARTVDFYLGLIIKRGIEVGDNEKIKKLLVDVDGEGTSLYNFSAGVVEEVVKVGFGGILVEYDAVPEEIITVKEAKERGYRPKMKWYPAESIINTRKNIRLLEKEYNDADEFDETTTEQIRVLDLDEEGFYRQRLYRYNEEATEWLQVGPDIYPRINNQMLKEIPFYPCNADKNSLEVIKPPLFDLAKVSLHHYGVYADYRNGIHFTGFPQLYISGKQDESKKLRLGSGRAWTFEDPTATVKYAEFHGLGLKHPESLLTRLEGYMGKLGARMLIQGKTQAESAEKATLDSQSEASVLAVIAKNCSDTLTKALNMYLKWNDMDVESYVELNQDYHFGQLEPATIIALMKGVQAGLVTEQVFLYNLKKGELVPDDKPLDVLLKEVKAARKKLEDKLLAKESEDINPLSERSNSGLVDPKDELRDNTRKKTDYEV